MKDNNYSWPLIIVLLFVFWPLGLYFLYKKAQSDKKTAMTASKILNLLGTVLIVIGVITLIVVIGIVYLIGGILLKRMAKKLLNSAEKVKQYLAIVINGNVRQLDSIAAATGKPYDVVKADIQKMIDDGYLRNAYIDESARMVVIPEAAPQAQPAYAGAAAPQARVVACPCCGANNTVYGAGTECESCGSPLQ